MTLGRVRVRWLLLTAIALIVVWYAAGGNDEIQWQIEVYRAAKQGWDLSDADRYPRYGLFYYAAAYGILIILVVGLIRGVAAVIRKILRARRNDASQAS